MTAPIAQTVTVEARDIRRGDVFVRHGYVRIATGPAGWGPYGSVSVPIDGGEVFFEKFAEVEVVRAVKRVPPTAP